MSELAVATSSVNLGQGFPDTDGPAEIAQAAADAIMAGRGNQYPPGAGIPQLREAIADHQRRFYGLDVDPDREVLVTAGATEAIAAALLALVEPGDEVIAFEPYYDSYAACIAMAGGVRVPVTLRAPDFRPDLDALRAAITDRTRLILLNSPHNPTGSVFTRAELTAIAELACSHDLLVISDEVYEHMVFSGEHVPVCTLPGMAQRTATISSAAKTFSFTGWKIGWVTGTPQTGRRRAHRQAVPDVRQWRAVPVRDCPGPGAAGGVLPSIAADLMVKRDLMCDGLASAGFEVYRPDGTYFITTDIRPFGDGGPQVSGLEFCRTLPKTAGVVAIPMQVFYDHPEAGQFQVRFAFCKRKEVLNEAIARLSVLQAG